MSRRTVPASRRLLAIVGPTAVGKSEFAVAVAEAVGGEIVNADALAMYRGLDIGTAKPGAEQLSRVPHHCFDIWDISVTASVAAYQRVARASIGDIWARGCVPVIVGGSPLYVRAVCDVLEIPPRDPDIRRRLQDEADRLGGSALHVRLRGLDPQAAESIDPRNTRRIVRALEVVELTGSFRARLPEPQSWAPTSWIGVDRPRFELDERIAARAQHMWSTSLLDEVRSLPGLADSPTASRAIGYKQALAVIAGEMTADQGLTDTVRLTRRLARRQQRTFRSDARIQWLTAPQAAANLPDLVQGLMRDPVPGIS